MGIILGLTTVTLIVGSVAVTMATKDFKVGTTFRRSTAVAVYLGWFCHTSAFIAALVFDPYRVRVPGVPAAVVGVVLIAVGLTLFVLGLQGFQSFGQISGTELGGLITSGVYSVSRNPQYTGWILLLGGAAVTARSPLALTLALTVVVAMRVWIPQEERHLEEEFGDEYLRYRQRVPRFVRLNRGR